MKKIIVSGCLGQDGSIMSDYILNNTDCEIYGVSRHYANPNHKNIEHLKDNPRFHLVCADLCDQHSIDIIVKEIMPDYFINFAANSFVGCSWDMPEQVFDINTIGVLRCLESIRKFNPNCRFYSSGSSEEWGNVLYSPQDENHPLKPRSPYGASKASARHIVKVYRESYGLYAIQGWLANHESCRRGPEFLTRKVSLGVARIKKSIDENKSFDPIELGNIETKRDWSHALDFCDAIWRMLNQEKFNKNINDTLSIKELSMVIKEYVVASGENHTIKEFVEKSFKVAVINGCWVDKDIDTKFMLDNQILVKINPEFFRPAEVNNLLGNSTLIRKELNWSPKISFENLVKIMVEYDLKNLK